MKFILELVLATIIIFFVWNILKRLFFNSFYKNFPSLNPRNYAKPSKTASKKIKEKVDWDAETVDFEEIPDNKNKRTDN